MNKVVLDNPVNQHISINDDLSAVRVKGVKPGSKFGIRIAANIEKKIEFL